MQCLDVIYLYYNGILGYCLFKIYQLCIIELFVLINVQFLSPVFIKEMYFPALHILYLLQWLICLPQILFRCLQLFECISNIINFVYVQGHNKCLDDICLLAVRKVMDVRNFETTFICDSSNNSDTL